MAERTGKPGKARGKKAPAVIDVGDGEVPPKNNAEDEDEDKDGEGEADDGVDVEMAQASKVIDIDSDDGDDRAVAELEKQSTRGGSLAKRDPMAAYMREVRRYPLLTPTEEHDLAVKLVAHGDTQSARKLIEANLRLVVKIAYEYRRAHKNLLDLVQEG